MEKKGKRTEAESPLPEAIIQHIQSFLSGKEAAQTILLSKSWYTAWLTRPDLDFDQKHFVSRSACDGENTPTRLWKFVNKTLERYERLNLRINTLRLWVDYSKNEKHYSNVSKLIIRALKMGAIGLDFKIHRVNWEYAFPHAVFGFENIIRLSVSGCAIDLGPDRKIKCWRLKSLTLEDVSENIIGDIISNCPLLENLSLSWHIVGALFNRPVIPDEFNKLKRLMLYRGNIHPSIFKDFSCKFPCLKELVLHHCLYYDVIQISSPSLECIHFTQEKWAKISGAKFDVPNIRKFTFSGFNIPLLSFCNTTNNWESEICIKRHSYYPSTSWFLKLNKLLIKMSLSKISSSLDVLSEKSLDSDGNIQGLPKAKVENLTINVPYSVCPAFLYGLFRCCRPIYITTHNWFPTSYKGGGKTHDFMEFVFKRMMSEVTLNSCIAYQRMSGEHDLEEVNVEFYDESISAWQPQLFDVPTNPGADKKRTRVHLKWVR